MKSLKYLALCLVAALVTTSCSNDENEPQAPARKGKAVKFEMSIAGVNTRTTTDASTRTTDWKVGDAVGIFVYEEGSLVYTNAKYQYDGTDWKCESNGVVVESGKSYKYYAYYPYQDGITTPTSVALAAAQDQNSENGYDLSDVLAASNENGTTDPDNSLVSLTFKHMYAMVEVSLFGDKVTQDPSAVKLLNVKLGGTLNLETQSVTNSGELTEVTMKYLGLQKEARAYRAVVPAQNITTGTPLVAVYDVDAAGKDFQFTYSKEVPYEQGKYRIMEVKIGEASSGITIPSKNTTIDPWTPSTSLDGTGSYEEIITPVTSIDLSFDASINIVQKDTYQNEKLIDKENYWFHRTNNITVAFDTDAIKAFSPTNVRLTWDKSSFGYHFGSNPLESGEYTFSFQAKTSNAQIGQSLGFAIRNATDTKGFQFKNPYSGKRTHIGQVITSEWATYSFVVNLGQASTSTALADVAIDAPFTATTAEDLAGLTIIMWNNVAAEYSLFIKDVKFEKITQP